VLLKFSTTFPCRKIACLAIISVVGQVKLGANEEDPAV